MASYSDTAFDKANAFSTGAFDFEVIPTFQPAFSDGAFGRNTAFSDQAFSFGPTPIPPIPPIPIPTEERAVGGVSHRRRAQQRLYDQRMEMYHQDMDDLQIVKLLTEFLSRM